MVTCRLLGRRLRVEVGRVLHDERLLRMAGLLRTTAGVTTVVVTIVVDLGLRYSVARMAVLVRVLVWRGRVRGRDPGAPVGVRSDCETVWCLSRLWGEMHNLLLSSWRR